MLVPAPLREARASSRQDPRACLGGGGVGEDASKARFFFSVARQHPSRPRGSKSARGVSDLPELFVRVTRPPRWFHHDVQGGLPEAVRVRRRRGSRARRRRAEEEATEEEGQDRWRGQGETGWRGRSHPRRGRRRLETRRRSRDREPRRGSRRGRRERRRGCEGHESPSVPRRQGGRERVDGRRGPEKRRKKRAADDDLLAAARDGKARHATTKRT